MNTRNLKWLRLRNWAVFVALIPVALVLSPVIGVVLAAQFVDENLRGGLIDTMMCAPDWALQR